MNPVAVSLEISFSKGEVVGELAEQPIDGLAEALQGCESGTRDILLPLELPILLCLALRRGGGWRHAQ